MTTPSFEERHRDVTDLLGLSQGALDLAGDYVEDDDPNAMALVYATQAIAVAILHLAVTIKAVNP